MSHAPSLECVQMAAYKYANILETNNHALFDQELAPGDNTPQSGIYGCLGCDKEIASNANNPLPPQNHHQHTAAQGRIRWKLRVAAIY